MCDMHSVLTSCLLAAQEVDGQLVTAQERSFVETVLMNDDSSQPATADAVVGLEPQRTIKINHLSFNENGELLTCCFGDRLHASLKPGGIMEVVD